MKALFTIIFVLLINIVFAQSLKEKKAERLFAKFDFTNAATEYKELYNAGKNKDHCIKRLADCYR